MYRNLLCALLLFPGVTLAVEPVTTRIESVVAPQVEAELLSGVLLVARKDKILFHRAYGYASWELRVPTSESNRFGIASITKPMTVILVQLLVKAGRIDLDAPVEKFIPGFPKGPKGGIPTIGHLLTHSSGVPHRVTEANEEAQPLHPSDIVQRVKATGLLFEPGTQTSYSSAGFTSLARVIEIIEKKSFDTILAERIFIPAGMTSAVSETGQRLMRGRALTHRLGTHEGDVVVKSAPSKDLRFLTGAGSVYATAEDLLHFVKAIRDGVFGGELWDQTFGGQAATDWHGWTGRTSGYEASVDVLPAEDLVFIFLSNLRSAANWQAREQIRRVLVNEEPAAIPPPPPVAGQTETPESLVGSYGRTEITFVGGKLFRGDSEFYPIDGGRYYIPASGTIMRFRRNSDGSVDAIVALGDEGREKVMPRSGSR